MVELRLLSSDIQQGRVKEQMKKFCPRPPNISKEGEGGASNQISRGKSPFCPPFINCQHYLYKLTLVRSNKRLYELYRVINYITA